MGCPLSHRSDSCSVDIRGVVAPLVLSGSKWSCKNQVESQKNQTEYYFCGDVYI